MVLMISYDINKSEPVEPYVHGGLMLDYKPEERDTEKVYDDLRKFIEKNAASWTRPLESQWFVKTEESPTWWTTELMKILDQNDRLFVCRIFPNPMPDPDLKRGTAYAGAIGPDDSKWLNSHVG